MQNGAIQNCKFYFFQFCTALLTLLMMAAESVLSKRPVLTITVALLFFLKQGKNFFFFQLIVVVLVLKVDFNVFMVGNSAVLVENLLHCMQHTDAKADYK